MTISQKSSIFEIDNLIFEISVFIQSILVIRLMFGIIEILKIDFLEI